MRAGAERGGAGNETLNAGRIPCGRPAREFVLKGRAAGRVMRVAAMAPNAHPRLLHLSQWVWSSFLPTPSSRCTLGAAKFGKDLTTLVALKWPECISQCIVKTCPNNKGLRCAAASTRGCGRCLGTAQV
jgi:hypothetical protein